VLGENEEDEDHDYGDAQCRPENFHSARSPHSREENAPVSEVPEFYYKPSHKCRKTAHVARFRG
jgi:hypothetical protein